MLEGKAKCENDRVGVSWTFHFFQTKTWEKNAARIQKSQPCLQNSTTWLRRRKQWSGSSRLAVGNTINDARSYILVSPARYYASVLRNGVAQMGYCSTNSDVSWSDHLAGAALFADEVLVLSWMLCEHSNIQSNIYIHSDILGFLCDIGCPWCFILYKLPFTGWRRSKTDFMSFGSCNLGSSLVQHAAVNFRFRTTTSPLFQNITNVAKHSTSRSSKKCTPNGYVVYADWITCDEFQTPCLR